MSNYTENFTSTSGDTVDATELEGEFDAISTAIATKLDSDGSGTMTGALGMGSNKITSVTDPTDAQDAATKAYVDARHAVQTEAATTSGTTVSFTGLPETASHIVVTLKNLSMSAATSFLVVRLGDSGGIENTGYTNLVTNIAQTTTNTTSTSGFLLHSGSNASSVFLGQAHLVKMSDHTWQCTSTLLTNTGGAVGGFIQSGVKTLSAAITQLELVVTTAGSFDAGSASVMVHS